MYPGAFTSLLVVVPLLAISLALLFLYKITDKIFGTVRGPVIADKIYIAFCYAMFFLVVYLMWRR